MSFPTAVMFLICAIGLQFIYLSLSRNRYIASSLVLTAVTLLIFLINLTLATGSLTNTETGMENLFVVDKNPETLNVRVAGVPAVPTMLNFILFGFFVIFSLADRVYWKKILTLISSLIFIIGLSAFIGYLTQTPLLYFQFSKNSIPMALNTAILFVLMGCGLFAASQIKNDNET